MSRRLLLGKGAAITYALRSTLTTTTATTSSSRGGGGVGCFSTSLPRTRTADAENALLPKLDILRSTGLSDTDILKRILVANPQLLGSSTENTEMPKRGTADVETKLQPMLRILRSTGLSDADIISQLLARDPQLLHKAESTKKSKLGTSSGSHRQLTALFRCYGIREEATKAILRKLPELLTANVEDTLRPKLDLLRGTGLTGADISQILAANPQLLSSSTENSISSCIDSLNTILPSKDAVILFLKRGNLTNIVSNMEVLKRRGVPKTWILKGFVFNRKGFAGSNERFLAAVGLVEDLGLSPNNGGPYVRALATMFYRSKLELLTSDVETDNRRPKLDISVANPQLSKKMELYKQLGWSEDQVVGLIRKYPAAMFLSDDTIRRKMEFFRDEGKWGTDFLFRCPKFFLLSLEKRIIPRCAVLNILISRGLLSKDLARLHTGWVLCTDKHFVGRYVHRYESKIPDVVNAFLGHIHFQGWDWLKDDEEEGLK